MHRFLLLSIILAVASCGRSGAQEHAGMRDDSVVIVDTLSMKDRDAFFKRIQSKAEAEKEGRGRNDREAIYPWADCAAHLKELKSYNALVTEMKCDKCGKRIVIVPFRSPEWTWKRLCGREGELYICPSCMRQVRFDCWVMN